jgi:acyl-CoA synthetase (AMP-forming)/AMP-acid ligase II
MSRNIASTLTDMAARQPDAAAILADPRRAGGKIGYSRCSYLELERKSEAIARGLRSLGLRRGDRAALCLRPGVDFFATTFALFKLGAVPVLIDPGIGLKNFGRCITQAEPAAFIGIPIVHLLRRMLGWARRTVRLNVSTGRFGGISLSAVERRGVHAAPAAIDSASAATDSAAILFTSGSTGPAKGVVYTHDNFLAQIDVLRNTYHIQPGEMDLATFPLFGLFGPALGMTTVIPAMDFTRPGFVDPRNIIEPILQLGITNMFGSPALIERVGRYGEKHGVVLPTLRRVISAGAPVPASTLARFAKMLSPGAEIFTPYGATESLPVTSIGSQEILAETAALTDAGKGVCVGRPAGEMLAKIIAIRDEPIAEWSDGLELPANQIGEIVVQGPVVTREYFQRAEATRGSKIQEGSAGRFYHRMGDVGYFDEAGRLWFCGRKSQRVRQVGGDLFSTPFEAVFNTHPHVAKSALVGILREGRQEPLICVELNAEGKRAKRSILLGELRALAERHPHTRVVREFLIHPRFPVDIRHNAKINREQLALWAQKKVT